MAYLQMRNITKVFGSVVANDHVDLDVERGEIHALLGENGAGKSTLMNVLYGMYDSFQGSIQLDGKPLHIRNPKDAIANGIGMVHQHFMLVNAHNVVENVILGLPGGPVLDIKGAAERISALANKLEIEIDPYARVGDLTVGQQQRVEIIKALYRDVKILILDEPTAVLTPGEVDSLFALLRKLTQAGMTVILISHKLAEIMDICTQCTILRQGRVVKTVQLNEIQDKYQLAALMVGQDLSRSLEKRPFTPGGTVLQVEDLCYRDVENIQVLDHISFYLRSGEILGGMRRGRQRAIRTDPLYHRVAAAFRRGHLSGRAKRNRQIPPGNAGPRHGPYSGRPAENGGAQGAFHSGKQGAVQKAPIAGCHASQPGVGRGGHPVYPKADPTGQGRRRGGAAGIHRAG